MITQSESGLSAGDYAELQTLKTGSVYNMTLQRLNFDWTAFGGTIVASTYDVDACTTTNLIIKLYHNALGEPIMKSHDGDPESEWQSVLALGGSAFLPWCLVASGLTIRVFYSNGTNIVYRESLDEGDTWGSEQTVMSATNVSRISAPALTRLHYTTYDTYNSRFHYVKYALGSWTTYSSDLYWPGEIENLSVVTVGYHDIIAFSALGPERYTLQSQGVWMTRVQSITRQNTTLWCDPREVDVLDEYAAGTDDRTFPLLSLINGLLFCTYVSKEGGSKQVSFSRSETGWFWEMRQPLGPFNSSLAYRGKLVALGDMIYFIGATYSYYSDSTPLSGSSTVELDYSDRVGGYQSVHQKARQIKVDLHDDDGNISATLEAGRWQVKEEIGYYASDGDPLLVQTGLLEADTITRTAQLPSNITTLVARDHMSWLTDRSGADQYEVRESQLRHWDDFAGDQGMRYTAVIRGAWDTSSNTLRLTGDNSDGMAFCSRKKFIGHTIAQAAFWLDTVGNSEYAGLVFRAVDQENYWVAYYSDYDDVLKIRQVIDGAWQTTAAQTSTLSWSSDTWYWIRIEARFSKFDLYYSTDGITWTLGCSHVDQDGTDAFREGYVGFKGMEIE